jgi:hypothetical protein
MTTLAIARLSLSMGATRHRPQKAGKPEVKGTESLIIIITLVITHNRDLKGGSTLEG